MLVIFLEQEIIFRVLHKPVKAASVNHNALYIFMLSIAEMTMTTHFFQELQIS